MNTKDPNSVMMYLIAALVIIFICAALGTIGVNVEAIP